jgi:hypothetical protein
MMQNFGRCIPNKPVFIERPLYSLPIYSINYDFVPTIPNAYPILWIDVKFPATDLGVQLGMQVFIEAIDRSFVPPPQLLLVQDIIGTRVALAPIVNTRPTGGAVTAPVHPFQAKNDFPKKTWSPLDHGGMWGYATRDLSSLPGTDQNWSYGNGNPVAHLRY